MLVLVPPTSKKIPSDTRRCMSAPATLAAGPDSMVRIGRFSTSPRFITPPSPRMIMSGHVMPAARTLSWVSRCRLHHLGQDAGVDHGRAGADGEAVELGDLVSARGGQPRP